MSDRNHQASTAKPIRGSSDATQEEGGAPRPAPGLPVAARPVNRPAPPPLALSDFLSGSDGRLRDLLAFGMAAEAGQVPGPDGIAELRRTADAELEAHAFRVLHNQAEAIRRQAMDDQLVRLPRGLSFVGAVLATATGILLFLLVLAVVWLVEPNAFGELQAQLAQLAARLRPGS